MNVLSIEHDKNLNAIMIIPMHTSLNTIHGIYLYKVPSIKLDPFFQYQFSEMSFPLSVHRIPPNF